MSTHSRWSSLSPPICPTLVFQMLSFYIHFCSTISATFLLCLLCTSALHMTMLLCVHSPEICPEVSTTAHLLHQKMHCFGTPGSFSCPFHPLPLLFWAIVPICFFASLRSSDCPLWAPDARLPLPHCLDAGSPVTASTEKMGSSTPGPGPAPVWADVEMKGGLGYSIPRLVCARPLCDGDVGLPLGKCVKFEHAQQGKFLGDTSYLLCRGLCLPWVCCVPLLDMGTRGAFHFQHNLKLLET